MDTAQTSGLMSETIYIGCVHGDPIRDSAISIATACKPAKAQFLELY
jgi:hypothetical protein